MNKFLDMKNTEEFVHALCDEIHEERGDCNYLKINGGKSAIIDYQLVMKTKKGGSSPTGYKPDEVWMHPLLFIKFAMWLNPRFEVKVLKFVQDNLIAARNRIADGHRVWTDTLKSVGADTGDDYAAAQRLANMVAFGDSFPGIRNTVTDADLERLAELERTVNTAVKHGFIKDFPSLVKFLSDEYQNRHGADALHD